MILKKKKTGCSVCTQISRDFAEQRVREHKQPLRIIGSQVGCRGRQRETARKRKGKRPSSETRAQATGEGRAKTGTTITGPVLALRKDGQLRAPLFNQRAFLVCPLLKSINLVLASSATASPAASLSLSSESVSFLMAPSKVAIISLYPSTVFSLSCSIRIRSSMMLSRCSWSTAL